MVIKTSKKVQPPPPPPPKRKPGSRAGLTKPAILAVATELLEAEGADKFSLRLVAKKLGVAPAVIHAHFKDGLGEVMREIARTALDDLTPPFKPHQDPKDYLRDRFRSILSTFRGKPTLGRIVLIHLTNDPFLSPVFAERMLATIEALTGSEHLADGYSRMLARLSGLVLIETGKSALIKPEAVKADLTKKISTLAPAEFPTLIKAAGEVAANALKRSDPGYAEEAADEVAKTLNAELQVGAT